MGFFRSTPHRSKSTYDDEEPLQSHHEVLELEPTTSTPIRPTSSSSDASYDETTNNNSASKQRQRQKRRKRYRQQGGYQRLGGQIVNAWYSVTALPSSDHQLSPQENHTGHITEDDEAMHYPENDIDNRFKRSLYLLLEEPSSSHAAFWTNVVVSFLIVSSAVMTTIETIPAFRSAESNRVW